MTPVFGHGRLRLYLLRLLDEEPRHGYDVIRLLEDRFVGTYSPSAGTIYPRLQRLEAEGLIAHEIKDGKKVYRITDAGREELRARADELADLEADIMRSVRDLAGEIREEVRGSVRDIRDELKQAARDIRRQQRHDNRVRRGDAKEAWTDAAREIRDELRDAVRTAGTYYGQRGHLDRELANFRDRVREVAGRAGLSDEQLRECAAALDEAYHRIAAALRRQDDGTVGGG